MEALIVLTLLAIYISAIMLTESNSNPIRFAGWVVILIGMPLSVAAGMTFQKEHAKKNIQPCPNCVKEF